MAYDFIFAHRKHIYLPPIVRAYISDIQEADQSSCSDLVPVALRRQPNAHVKMTSLGLLAPRLFSPHTPPLL